MPSTYNAVLTGGTLQWSDEVPEAVATGQPVSVQVTILDESLPHSQRQARGHQMAAALDRLAASSGLPRIADPVAWQRDIRQDRGLPGRDD